MRKKIIEGIYRDTQTGRYYERPWVRGRRTWRRLEGHTLKLARESYARRRADVGRAALGLARDPYRPTAPDLAWILEKYEAAGCPGRRGRAPNHTQLYMARGRLRRLAQWWPRFRPEEIQAAVDCRKYFKWRTAGAGRGARAVELELGTLANAMAWAVQEGFLDQNPFDGVGLKFRTGPSRHCREVAPHTAEEVHALAAHFFEHPRSQAMGWQLLLQALTGCRSVEVLRLRWDARHRGEPGFIEGQWLWLARAKGGINPFALIHPALRDCLEAMRRWRMATRARKSPWFIPASQNRVQGPASPISFPGAMQRASALVLGRPVTPHGLRSFYVTVRRSQGIADGQIAAEIGDKTGAAMIVETYGSIPPNWQGQAALGWIPKKGPPAWARWLDSKVVRLEGLGGA